MRIEEAQEIVLTGKREVRLKRDSAMAVVNGQETALEAPVKVKRGTFLIPLSAVCKSMGLTLCWRQGSGEAYLIPEDRECHLYSRGREFVLIVANHSDQRREYEFDSGKTHDFILKMDGREVWRYSAGKAWIQIISSRELMPGECWVYSAFPEADPPEGRYTVEGYFFGKDLLRRDVCKCLLSSMEWEWK